MSTRPDIVAENVIDAFALFSRRPSRVHFAGFILNRLKLLAADDPNGIVIDNHQQNGAHGVHQARVKVDGDETVYRLILAPADAPIELYGHPIGDAFAYPLPTE